jgi:phage-related protein (TIGR01555 family)
MEFTYRGSWVAGVAVDAVAEDMTREGVEVHSDDSPDDLAALDKEAHRLQLWKKLCQAIKWARLYGGALAFLMIDGQKPDTPLKLDALRKGQFRGIMPLDRWMTQPSLNDLVSDMGPDFGKPKFYQTVSDSMAGLPQLNIHHSRVIRIEGVELPFWQAISENLWGQSVLERLWDRLIAFDSVTNGAGQLVYKAHLRTYSVEGLREIIGMGGKAMDGLLQQIAMIRTFQTNEGMTLMDAKDKFEPHAYTFAGLAEMMQEFAQQISGALQIPMVRLLGQSPAGFSNGDADLHSYFDGIKQQQENKLRAGVETLYRVLYVSKFGKEPGETFDIQFRPLFQIDEEKRANITTAETAAVVGAFESQIIDKPTALKELRQSSKITGMWSNITDDMIGDAEDEAEELANAPSPGSLGLDPANPAADPAPGEGGEKVPRTKPAVAGGLQKLTAVK